MGSEFTECAAVTTVTRGFVGRCRETASAAAKHPRRYRQLRRLQVSQYTAWLRTQTNKQKRPFQEQTLVADVETAHALDRWMTDECIDGDFGAPPCQAVQCGRPQAGSGAVPGWP
jgi:hypothetical protein